MKVLSLNVAGLNNLIKSPRIPKVLHTDSEMVFCTREIVKNVCRNI